MSAGPSEDPQEDDEHPPDCAASRIASAVVTGLMLSSEIRFLMPTS
jgi:hypothetical protein